MRIEKFHLGRAVGGGAPDKTETFSMLISPITWVDKTMELPWVALNLDVMKIIYWCLKMWPLDA